MVKDRAKLYIAKCYAILCKIGANRGIFCVSCFVRMKVFWKYVKLIFWVEGRREPGSRMDYPSLLEGHTGVREPAQVREVCQVLHRVGDPI